MNTFKSAIFLILILSSCSTKKYEDFQVDDFIEVQGIITSAKRTSYPFDSAWHKDIKFTYFINGEKILFGSEDDLNFTGLIKGQPIIVLVHKNDESISFYGRNGILDNLTEIEVNYMKPIIEQELKLINKK